MAFLASLCGSALSTVSGNAQVELVLAMKEGDSIEWAQKYAQSAHLTVYNKGQPLVSETPLSEVALANVGREAHAYLYHIVHRFDSLAPKTVFMPGGLPTAGFHGFARSGGSLLPGAKLEDYLAQDVEELLIPTMALTPDLQSFSVRMSLMDNKTESGLKNDARYSVCSADGTAGWSPFLPNKFSSTVLEPLMTQQHARWTFGSFWSHYLPDLPIPEHVMVAHSSVFSVSRDNLRQHPKAFYEALLAELEGAKDPYQAFFLEHMWWYLFHPKQAAPCTLDVAPPASRKAASRELTANSNDGVASHQRRRMSSQVITVLSPSTASQVEFGTTVNIAWTSDHDGFYRIELWRFGNFETRLYDSKHVTANTGASVNWHVFPGPSADDAPTSPTSTKTFNALRAGASVSNDNTNTKTWLEFNHALHLKPGTQYTIRVCPYTQNSDEQICDNVFGESGEFDIIGVIDMLSPVNSQSFKPKDMIPITWQSYWTGDKVDLTVRHEGHTVFQDLGTSDDGVYTFFISPDMKPGSYEVSVAAFTQTGVANYCTRRSCKTYFTLIGNPAPPPPPPLNPSPPPPPLFPGADSWEVPIIQAFKGSFGLDEITAGPNAQNSYATTSTVSGGLNCDYVCHVYNTHAGVVQAAAGRRSRRLLFGGLQYYDAVDTNTVVGCSLDMKKCGCCAGCTFGTAC